MRMITVNEADAATITAIPAAVATMPATNLQNPSRIKMRCTQLTNQAIKLVWPSTRILSGLALLRHNLTSQATWQVQIWSDAAATQLVWDSGVVPTNPAKALGDLQWGIEPLGASVFTGWAYAFSTLWFAPVAGQAATITLTDSGNPDGFLQAARLFVGNYIEPINGASYGLKLKWTESTRQRRTDGGSLRSDAAEPYRTLAINLEWLSDSERSKLLEVGRLVGLRKDIFMSIYPEKGGALERDNTMQCKLTSDIELTTLVGRYNAPLTLQEA